ncbi:cript family protein [Colletotrichum higginsianum]|uniref:Cript family protein n=1 Tax=Colletotrichum higginsianum (strain IMI 349063) TaxID=759273 RepID=H1V3J5_COLHI|nr:cript family protein [Colletotrichum higginsianum]
MVCTKCQKLGKGSTTLATPAIKKKSEIYHGSSASASSSSPSASKPTLGSTGIGKSKLSGFALASPRILRQRAGD